MAKDRYWHSIGAVLTGTAVAQIIPTIGALVIARQYAPAEFGVFSVWLGIVSFISIVLTGRFETVLAIVPDGEPRRQAVVATLATAILSACASAVIVVISIEVIPAAAEELSPSMAMLLVPTALVVAAAQTWQSWAAAEGSYRYLSLMRITQATAVTILQIIAGVFTPSASAMAMAHFGGTLAGLALSIYLLPLGSLVARRVKEAVLALWAQYRRFPLFALPADSINTAAAQLPIVLVAARFGSETAGLLSLTLRVLGAPIGLLGKSILDVFKRHAAASYRERGECRAEYERTFRILAPAAFGFGFVMYFVSEPLFAIGFGEKWSYAGIIAVWLLPLFALRFIASPLSYMVYIAGKPHLDLVWQIALLATTIATLTIPDSHEIALQAYSVGYGLLYLVYLAMSYRFSKGRNE
jgi:O-antigen/teichoic acid export membrane protein